LKLTKIKENQENVCCQPEEIKIIQKDLANLKTGMQRTKEPSRSFLNSSLKELENCSNVEENNSVISIQDESNQTISSNISEIVDVKISTPPNENKKDISTHPTSAQYCWKTPDALHCSLNELFPAQNTTGPPRRSVIANRYRIDYTESPAQYKQSSTESESECASDNNQSFLEKRRPGQSSL
jgi:hypothetical protein